MTTLCVPDMSCNHCRSTVLSALEKVPLSGVVTVDLTSRKVEVTGAAPIEALLFALEEAGYPATPA